MLSSHDRMAVYRVHWLKAKARRDRWREEQILLASEMQWTELFFHHRASQWKALTAESSAAASHGGNCSQSDSRMPLETENRRSEGHICYALKLESRWNRLAQQAAVKFSAVKGGRARSLSSSSEELSL